MKRLISTCLALLVLPVTSSAFAAPAKNIATSDRGNGMLQVDLNALKQGAADGTVVPIVVSKELQILVPTVSTPDGVALAAAASEYLSQPGVLDELGRNLAAWKSYYAAHRPSLMSQGITQTDFANGQMVEYLNTSGTGIRGQSAADQVFTRASSLRQEVSSTTRPVGGLKGSVVSGPGTPPLVNAGCGPRGRQATIMQCCTGDPDGGFACKMCDCWRSATNCCIYGPLEISHD